MADDSDLEKTESPSPRRLEQAREEGQVARSRELATFALLAAGFGGAYILGDGIGGQMLEMFRSAFTFDRSAALDPTRMLPRAAASGMQGAMAIAPLGAMMYLAALLAPMALGGWLLTTKPLVPNFSRLNPISGLGKIFSSDGLVQLVMSLAKCLLVGGVALSVAWHGKDQMLGLVTQPVRAALGTATHLIGTSCALIVASMLLLVAVDVPWQMWQHNKKLRMTKEEVKREYKENEGDPHIKGKIRAQQRAMAKRRMMQQVPTADVVVTNPTHFAVALKYAEGSNGAPRVVAKGAGAIALRIRELAAQHNVPTLEAPPLARALYRHTDLNQEIPNALYGAVAEVLAWVYQLRQWHSGAHGAGAHRPNAPTELDVPPELDIPAAARDAEADADAADLDEIVDVSESVGNRNPAASTDDLKN